MNFGAFVSLLEMPTSDVLNQPHAELEHVSWGFSLFRATAFVVPYHTPLPHYPYSYLLSLLTLSSIRDCGITNIVILLIDWCNPGACLNHVSQVSSELCWFAKVMLSMSVFLGAGFMLLTIFDIQVIPTEIDFNVCWFHSPLL